MRRLLLAVLMAFALPLSAQELNRAPIAVTGCSDSTATGYPVTEYRVPSGFLTPEQAAEIAVHEVVHRRQLVDSALGITCIARLVRITLTPDSALKYEIPAYCAQIHFDVDGGNADFVVLRSRIANIFAQVYRIDALTTARAFAKGCPSVDEMPSFQGKP